MGFLAVHFWSLELEHIESESLDSFMHGIGVRAGHEFRWKAMAVSLYVTVTKGRKSNGITTHDFENVRNRLIVYLLIVNLTPYACLCLSSCLGITFLYPILKPDPRVLSIL